ncbi:MAG TPA: hypothetical protein VEZ90_19975 [Blastocatellia bacterium]|nr:hypothetical protein [Blastocatellia bacterium]
MTGNASSRYQVQFDVESICRNAWSIVLALAASIVLYAIIGLAILRARTAPPGPVQVRIPLYVAAFFLALASLAYRRTQLRWLRLESVARVKGTAGLAKHLYATTLISAALGEAIGLIGLMMSVAGGDLEDILSLGIVGLLTILISYPRRRAWVRTVEYLISSDADTSQEEQGT